MILSLGDSVPWGQGLTDPHKFDTLLAAHLAQPLVRRAHSGAILGAPSDVNPQLVDDEIPVSYPSVFQQLARPTLWSQVSLILLNGGMNDVDLRQILNPWTTLAEIDQRTDEFCRTQMTAALLAAAAKLTQPEARIVVLGYYPILSPLSDFADPKHFQLLLELHSIPIGVHSLSNIFPVESLLPKAVANCMRFWQQSDLALHAAVTAANQTLGRQVCLFAKLPLSETNALYAPNPLLWHLDVLLSPTDELRDHRAEVCESLYAPLHIPKWVQCDRASLGHPNIAAAALIAQSLITLLTPPQAPQ